MKSKRHIHLGLGMTDYQLRELLTALSLAPESCPFARELGVRLYEASETSPKNEVLHYEEETPEVLAERNMCEEHGCENPVDEEGSIEGLCAPCEERFLATHTFVSGHGPGTGWINNETGRPSYEAV